MSQEQLKQANQRNKALENTVATTEKSLEESKKQVAALSAKAAKTPAVPPGANTPQVTAKAGAASAGGADAGALKDLRAKYASLERQANNFKMLAMKRIEDSENQARKNLTLKTDDEKMKSLTEQLAAETKRADEMLRRLSPAEKSAGATPATTPKPGGSVKK